MFSQRALIRTTITFTLVLSGLAHARAALAQELSPAILQNVPRVVERLRSQDIHERISVLDELVTVTQGAHIPKLVFTYSLPPSDYAAVVKSILDANLDQIDDKTASGTWWKITHVIEVFKLKELAKPLTLYLPKSGEIVQFAIVRTLRILRAVESVPQVVPLLKSPRNSVRQEALSMLVSLRAKEAIPPLVAFLQDDNMCVYAMTTLVQLNATEAIPAIVKILQDKNENNRYWALDALVKFHAREHAQAAWKLTEANEPYQTQAYAVAALIYFGEQRAIPLAVKKATVSDLSRRLEMLRALVNLKAKMAVPALVAVLDSKTVLGDDPTDTGQDSNIRRDIMTCLGELQAREAIPVLRSYARGRGSNTFLQQAAVKTLGVLRARESVNDLLLLLDKPATDEEYATAEVGVALAQIGDRTTWRKLIDLAARPNCTYRSEIISQLNRHLDPELWKRVQTLKVHGWYVKSVKSNAEAFSSESGIRILLDYQPGRDSSPRATLTGDGYPWANTGGVEISLSYGLSEIIEGLGDDRIPRTYTFIFEDKQIRILSVERAIEWWRKQILSKL